MRYVRSWPQKRGTGLRSSGREHSCSAGVAKAARTVKMAFRGLHGPLDPCYIRQILAELDALSSSGPRNEPPTKRRVPGFGERLCDRANYHERRVLRFSGAKPSRLLGLERQ